MFNVLHDIVAVVTIVAAAAASCQQSIHFRLVALLSISFYLILFATFFVIVNNN